MPMSNVKIKEDSRITVEPSTVSGISAFLGKLWKMVEDPKTDHLISWGKSGNSFVIKNQIDFAKTILPNYYKHNNIASFIRQLNMYGFHKIISTTSGALDSVDNDEIEFTHPNFVRGRPYLLEQIKRKMNNPKENITKNENNNQFNDSIKRVLIDIKHLKGKQDNLNTQLCSVKQENEILWRELSLLRQKHAAQQNILNKLIRFLVSLAQPNNHGLVKRRLIPLMLRDSTSLIKAKNEPIIQESDHLYSVKKREVQSPGPTIHEIHSSDLMDDVIIDSPVLEVATDGSVLDENEIVNSPTSSISPSERRIASPEPIPAALLCSDAQGKKHIQTVYITQDQPLSPHFLISEPSSKDHKNLEYLIPEQTEHPLMELVHESEGEEDDEYITVDLLPNNIHTTLVADASSSNKILQNKAGSSRKRQLNPRKKVNTKKANNSVSQAVEKSPAQKIKQNTKKKTTSAAMLQENKEADDVTNEIQLDDFLFDINLQPEPLVEMHTPKTSALASSQEIPSESTCSSGTSSNPPLKIEIPMTVEDVMSEISPKVDAGSAVDASTASNLLSPHNRINPISSLNIVTPISPLSPISQSTNTLSSGSGISENANPDVTLAAGSSAANQSMISAQNKLDTNNFIDQINECIDNAHNMKIACTSDAMAPSKSYVEDISTQLDSMQAEINNLKDLMQNEGITFDVNTLLGLFSEDQEDYNIPSSANDPYKSNEQKIMGNELISASQAFDFNDLFPNDWNQPSTPVSSYDTDYYSLNTPQFEKTTEEVQSMFAPPNKKIKNVEEDNSQSQY